MSHKNENKFLHCTECFESEGSAGLEVFVTPTADLGIQCFKHKNFVVVIPHGEIKDYFSGIAQQECGNLECKCKPEVSH